MSILDWFEKKKKQTVETDKLNIPGDVWVKCKKCSQTMIKKDLVHQSMVCSNCNFHFRISPKERIDIIFDSGSFKEESSTLSPVDFLDFEDVEKYSDRIEKVQDQTGKTEALIIGSATLRSMPVNVALMDFSFMGGSMGSVVGEKITRIIESATKNKHPLIIFTSSGGARMQEGIVSLMQMAKTSAALSKLSDEGIPYISVLCDPTTGGTSASFAMLGDIHVAEPGALISFAGPRVIEQTIRQKVPKGFQRAEFLLKHGMVDMVVDRKKMRETLYNILNIIYPVEV